MGYLSLYRKWRPRTFDDLAGQNTVVKTLKNAILTDRIAHAYLFCGPRGTGKTSTAKIFAKTLNCANRVGTELCNQCFSCEQINSGRSVDVIEIDAASNRRIDEIRDLREKVKFSPSEGEYKVYIIDEVHMLTKEAFNALLKTLEEPPANVVFILATTEPHKILPTIISRCQRFDFGLLHVRDLKERLRYICEQEGIEMDDHALSLIARTAEGGMRDAISALDQAIAFGGDRVTVEDVNTILGKVEQRLLAEIVEVMAIHDARRALQLVNEIVDQGKDMNQFVKDLLYHFRDLMLIKECGVQNTLQELLPETKDELAAQAGRFTTKDLLRILELLSETDQQLKLTSQPRLTLELMMIKLTTKEVDISLTNLIHRLARLEEMVESGHRPVRVETAKPSPTTPQPEISFADKVKMMREKGTGRAQEEVSPSDLGPTPVAQGRLDESTSFTRGVTAPVTERPGDVDLPWHDQPPVAPTQSANDTEPVAEERTSPSDRMGTPMNGSSGPDLPGISAEEVENYWNLTMNLLQKSSETRKLRAFLIVAKPYRVMGDTLYIVFPQSSTFHKSNAEKELDLLERALKKVTGLNLKACCIFTGEEQELSQAATSGALEMADQPNPTPTSQPTSEDIHQHPIVQKTLKIFGGKVIQVENE